MIYGINFNGVKIPDGYLKRFAKRIRVCSECIQRIDPVKGQPRHYSAPHPCLMPSGSPNHKLAWAYLSGVATDRESKEDMLIQATNGHRHLFVIEQPTAGANAFGIYTY